MPAETWLWIVFGVVVAGVLAFDVGVLARQRRAIGLRESLRIVGAYALLACGFGAAIFVWIGPNAGLEYFTAYLIEESLSLDNIFVWLLIFRQLQVPEEARHKVLFWGVVGAIVLRGAFIFAGVALANAFEWMLYLFGAIVLLAGARMLAGIVRKRSEEGGGAILRLLRLLLPATEDYHGRRFTVRIDGKLRATPLLLALIAIELSDIVFALDSIPAILGVTRDRLVVFSSNVFAILGLRALFFAVEDLAERLRYLRHGLALLLILIGAKMLAGGFVDIPIWLTLGATLAVLGGAVGYSLLRGGPIPPRASSARAARDGA